MITPSATAMISATVKFKCHNFLALRLGPGIYPVFRCPLCLQCGLLEQLNPLDKHS